jgi:hypothetical protein
MEWTEARRPAGLAGFSFLRVQSFRRIIMKSLAKLALGIPIAILAVGCSERVETAAPPYTVEEGLEARPTNGGVIAQAMSWTDVSDRVTTIPASATVLWRSVQFANNLDGCSVYGVGSQYAGKIDTGSPGTYKIPGTDIDVTLVSLGLINGVQTYQISIQPGYVMTDIFLKHARDFNEWFQFTPGVSFASGIFTAQAGLSHFSVCANDAALPLTFDHQVEASYDRTIEWELSKTVEPALHEGMPGDTFESTWNVIATKFAEEGNEQVIGSLIVGNPNAFAVPVTLAVTLNGTSVPVICPGTGNNTGSVPAMGSLVCSYDVAPPNRSASMATGILTPGNPMIPGDTVTVPFMWQENLNGFEAGSLEDPRVAFSESVSASRTLSIPETFACPTDPGSYTDGFLSFTETNVVTLNGGIMLTDTATVDIICNYPDPLTFEHLVEASYDRTVDWELSKTVEPALHEGMPGDLFQSTWSVVATKFAEEGNEYVSGTLLIGNSNAFAVPISLEVTLNGTPISVVCPGTGNNTGEVPALGSLACTYEATPADRSATSSTGILISGNPLIPGDTAVAGLLWQENLNGFESGSLEDPRVAFSESVSASRTVAIPETFACPTDPGSYIDGFLSFTETNVVTLNGGIMLTDTATVDIICRMPPGDSETAWAANGNEPGSLRYTDQGNWATYLTYGGAPKTVTLFAGQTQAAGTVTLSAPSGGLVTITITLNPGWSFYAEDTIHIQDYATAPSGNPAPGQFMYKFAPGEPIQVPVNNFYGIHVVVQNNNP